MKTRCNSRIASNGLPKPKPAPTHTVPASQSKIANPQSKILPRLPLLNTFEDAQTLAAGHNDLFYVVAFFIQCWLGELFEAVTAQYADIKNPRDRSLQTGHAWRHFLHIFGSLTAKGFNSPLAWLYRFSLCDDSPGNSLRRALVPLLIEHECTGNYCGLGTFKNPHPGPLPNELASRTILRWCDWLDAAMHLRTHRRWHAAPDCFDPDPETRHLAILGNAQRHLANLNDRARLLWMLEFDHAAKYYQNSPKWPALAKGMTAQPNLWLYPQVDTLVIALWPLVKQYNWTYRDLLNTIRPALKRPDAYPCACEQQFATYCANVLGLRKTGKGVTSKNGHPAGYDIAIQLCPALHPNPKPKP